MRVSVMDILPLLSSLFACKSLTQVGTNSFQLSPMSIHVGVAGPEWLITLAKWTTTSSLKLPHHLSQVPSHSFNKPLYHHISTSSSINYSHLVCSPPVSPGLKHAFPQHGHHLRVVLIGEGVLGYFGHEGSVGSPRFIVGGFTDFGLHLRVVHDHVGPEGEGGAQWSCIHCKHITS